MKQKFVTHEEVMQKFEKKWPGVSKEIEAEISQLHIAGHITELRRQTKLSQKVLAEKIGTTQSAVARMESPGYHDYKVSTLFKIAQVTGGAFRISASRNVHGSLIRGSGHSSVRMRQRVISR